MSKKKKTQSLFGFDAEESKQLADAVTKASIEISKARIALDEVWKQTVGPIVDLLDFADPKAGFEILRDEAEGVIYSESPEDWRKALVKVIEEVHTFREKERLESELEDVKKRIEDIANRSWNNK